LVVVVAVHLWRWRKDSMLDLEKGSVDE